jgi:hypothetical protein
MRADVDELAGTTRPEALGAFIRHGHAETAGEDTGELDEWIAALDQEITNRMASGPVPPQGWIRDPDEGLLRRAPGRFPRSRECRWDSAGGRDRIQSAPNI